MSTMAGFDRESYAPEAGQMRPDPAHLAAVDAAQRLHHRRGGQLGSARKRLEAG